MRTAKFIILLTILLCCASIRGAAQITKDEALSKFVAAGLAYQDEKYATAIERYNEIIEGGRESGALYYNLGNSYFRNGQLGKAMLNYERAKRFIPRDSDLKFNQRYARAMIDRTSEEEQGNLLVRMTRDFVQWYTTEEMILAITGLIFGAGFLYLLFLYLNWPRVWYRWIAAVSVILVLVYTAGLAIKVRWNEDCAVIVSATDAYFEPREDSTMHFKLPEGVTAKVQRSEGGWVKVRRPDGRIGWVTRESLEKI